MTPTLPPGSLRECITELEDAAWRAGAASVMDMENGQRPVRCYVKIGESEKTRLDAARERVEGALRVSEQLLSTPTVGATP